MGFGMGFGMGFREVRVTFCNPQERGYVTIQKAETTIAVSARHHTCNIGLLRSKLS